MKIAYLITAYGDFGHLERLVGALDDDGARFFIHVDGRSDMPPQLFSGRGNVTLIPRRKVWWGGWSHTAAILDLMREGVKCDPDYCWIASGSDYPIRPREVIYETLAQGGEFINAAEGFRGDKPEKRIRYYWFDGYDRRAKTPKALMLRGFELLLRSVGIRKRRYPFGRPYVGTVWSALSAECVRYILGYVDAHPEYVSFFRTAKVPEELFFHTIIGNSPFGRNIRGSLTYSDWSGGGSGPAVITADKLPSIAPGTDFSSRGADKVQDYMFARKFSSASGAVLETIDRDFRRAGGTVRSK